MSGQVVFYDLPSQHKGDGAYSCFSLNPWKTRMVLNYKKIPYRTEFLEYPDFGPRLIELGVPPQGEDAFAAYTSPTIQLPDGTFVVESNNCAEALDSLYPEPSLHLDAQLHRNIMKEVDQVANHVFPLALIICVRRCLPERSAKFFLEDRERRFGISLEDLSTFKGEEAWKAGETSGSAFEQLKNELHKHKKDDGPFILGSQVSYGDFIIASLFESMGRVDKQLFDRLVGYDSSFKRLHEVCQRWLEKDN